MDLVVVVKVVKMTGLMVMINLMNVMRMVVVVDVMKVTGLVAVVNEVQIVDFGGSRQSKLND